MSWPNGAAKGAGPPGGWHTRAGCCGRGAKRPRSCGSGGTCGSTTCPHSPPQRNRGRSSRASSSTGACSPAGDSYRRPGCASCSAAWPAFAARCASGGRTSSCATGNRSRSLPTSRPRPGPHACIGPATYRRGPSGGTNGSRRPSSKPASVPLPIPARTSSTTPVRSSRAKGPRTPCIRLSTRPGSTSSGASSKAHPIRSRRPGGSMRASCRRSRTSGWRARPPGPLSNPARRRPVKRHAPSSTAGFPGTRTPETIPPVDPRAFPRTSAGAASRRWSSR